jgi:TRAP-type C4-dicarboxylate transport system permease small subunit
MTSMEREGAPPPPRQGGGAATVSLLARVIRWWALAGGFVTAGLALLTTASAVSNIIWHAPIAADYELVKQFIGVAIFMFLPYCQLVGANVTVDIFTEGMSEGKKAAMALFSSFFAVAFAVLLLRQMWFGMFSYIRFPEVTPVLQLPLWTAFPPILASLALLLVAAVITLLDGWRVMRGQAPWLAPTHPAPVE